MILNTYFSNPLKKSIIWDYYGMDNLLIQNGFIKRVIYSKNNYNAIFKKYHITLLHHPPIKFAFTAFNTNKYMILGNCQNA